MVPDQPLPNFLGAPRPDGQKTKGPFAGPEIGVTRFQARDEAGISPLTRSQSPPGYLLDINAQPATVIEDDETPLTALVEMTYPSLRTRHP